MIGIIYSLLLAILSHSCIIYSGNIFHAIGNTIGLEEETVLYIRDILEQLDDVQISVPYILVFFSGIVISLFVAISTKKYKRRILITIFAYLLMLLPLSLFTIFCTEINGIRMASSILKKTEKVHLHTINYESSSNDWYAGFGQKQIIPNDSNEQPLYIAGYNNGLQITNVLDYCEARAVWVDTGDKGILLIGIDCIALDSSTVQKIRENLADIPNCLHINVYATHTHAGADTLGMWGPIGIDGKNDSYMDALIEAATAAGYEAVDHRVKGDLFFGHIETAGMYRDSRDPQVYDANLYQLRFSADNGDDNIRFLFYGAHPEALRGDNTLLSRDYAGLLCDGVTDKTGDNTIFAPGALGGLIMTKEFFNTYTETGAITNLKITSNKLIDYALSITEDMEKKLTPNLIYNSSTCVIPMDNTAFMLYKLLGILNSKTVRTNSATGYGVETEVSVMQLDELAIALIPGEIFPELVYGGEYGDASSQNKNPKPLLEIAKENGIDQLLIIGLSNDEIGYIVPPSDFLLNTEKPYFEKIVDYKGENHYEETNSIGPKCAEIIAKTFKKLIN